MIELLHLLVSVSILILFILAVVYVVAYKYVEFRCDQADARRRDAVKMEELL